MYQDAELRTLWDQWREAHQIYLAREEALGAFESTMAPASTGSPRALIERAVRLRQEREEALQRYRAIDQLFVAARDRAILTANQAPGDPRRT